jgi:flap endonuclease-1
MGIKDFSKAFAKAFVPIKSFNDILSGKAVALDMHLLLYKSIKALGHLTLTDASGVPTSGINNLLNLIPKLRKAGITRIVAVFDNPNGGCPLKARVCEQRHADREDCKVRAATEENEEVKAQLETRAWTIDSAVIYDAQHFLSLLGVESHIAPEGFEAEHYAAHLAATGYVDAVISDDSDTVMFGSPVTIFPRSSRVGKTNYKYAMIDIRFLLSEYGITFTEFQRICIALGSDFAEKTVRVGPATALTRGKNIEPTDEQQRALTYVASRPEGVTRIIPSRLALAEAAVWLSDSKGFDYSRVAKALGVSLPVIHPIPLPSDPKQNTEG